VTRPVLSLAAVVVLLATGVAVDELVDPAVTPVQVSRTAAVVGSSAVCPDLRQDAGVLTRVSAGVSTGAGGAGRIVVTPLRGTTAPTALSLTRPGQVVVGLGGSVDGDAFVVRAEGALAAGLEVEQVTRGERGGERGLAGLRCQAPSTQAWFVGGATVVGDATLLVLANPDDTPALVDVTVWSADGPVDPRSGRGISVAPRSRVAVRMDELAPDESLLALHVVAQRGRVAAALRQARFDSRTPGGVDWVPQAQPPSTTVVVPGLPQGPGRRVVLVTNPGPDPTVVQLELTTADSQSVPAELAAIGVPAGTTVATDITQLTDRSPMTVTVRSDGGPVLAGSFVYDAQGSSPVKDFAYGGSATPLSGPALITDVVIDRPTESTLLLSAPGADAVIDVRPVQVLGEDGPLPPARKVVVRAGRVVAVRLSSFLPAGATGRLAVEVTPQPGSGPVYAARYLRERGDRGPLTTLLTLQSASGQVALPAVRRDEMVGVSR